MVSHLGRGNVPVYCFLASPIPLVKLFFLFQNCSKVLPLNGGEVEFPDRGQKSVMKVRKGSALFSEPFAQRIKLLHFFWGK